MADALSIEPAKPADIHEIISFLSPAFDLPANKLLGQANTPEGRKQFAEHHIKAWELHQEESNIPGAIKCVHRDPQTGQETIVGFCEWFIYENGRSKQRALEPNYLLSGEWLDPECRRKARAELKETLDARVRWLGTRPCAILMYMVVRPEWQRKGISTKCVQWGLEKCDEYAIPAYLEASDEGVPVYSRLGFVAVDKQNSYPVMIRWGKVEKQERRQMLPEYAPRSD